MSLIRLKSFFLNDRIKFSFYGILLFLCLMFVDCHRTNIIPSQFPRDGESFKGVSFTSKSYVLGYFEGGHDRAECPEGIRSFKIFRSITDFFVHIFVGGLYDTRSVEIECVRIKLDFDSIVRSKGFVLRGVYFNSNSDRINEESFEILDELSEILRANPGLKILITGHTDLNGGEKQNRILSLKRAKSTKEYLLAQGIDTSRMEIRGLGSSRPIQRSLDESASFQNRRIEISATRNDENESVKKRIEPEDSPPEEYTSTIILRNGRKLYGNITKQTEKDVYVENKDGLQILSKRKIRKIKYNHR
ncbi:OmpA family protein [Leptospira kmetyi]|uniref:OmpA family protein n=1 Tax=Leptospira kmetyi TaxID=408139 RepID=UPI003EBAB9CC